MELCRQFLLRFTKISDLRYISTLYKVVLLVPEVAGQLNFPSSLGCVVGLGESCRNHHVTKLKVSEMSVELLDTTRFHGFRVRRQIAGKTYQEYFSLKANGKRLRGAARAEIKEAAETRDAVLANKQAKAKAAAAKTALFDKSGKVRGILFRMKTEKSGTRTPVFQIGIMSSKVDKIVNTTVSINLHGLKGAWQKAVDFYISHKKISKRSQTYKKLLKAQPSKAQLEAMKRKRKRRK